MREVSVIVVMYNRPKDVKEAAQSLSNQSVKPFEVRVIDDGTNPPLTSNPEPRT
jgi:glycosyltransferase involved in cell wall biosynthesis